MLSLYIFYVSKYKQRKGSACIKAYLFLYISENILKYLLTSKLKCCFCQVCFYQEGKKTILVLSGKYLVLTSSFDT